MKDLSKNANNECSKLKKKMGNKVNDEDWLNRNVAIMLDKIS